MKLFAFKGRSGKLITYTSIADCSTLRDLFTGYFELADQASEINPMDRAQRVLDMAHVGKIKRYLGRAIAVFASPVATATIKEIGVSPVPGVVEIEVSDAYLVDGQKRVKAFLLKHEEDPTFRNDVSLVLVDTPDLLVKQQLFSDINSTPAKVSPSLNLVYDHTQSLSSVIPKVVPRHLLEVDKGTVGKTSNKLITTTVMKEAIGMLLEASPATLNALPPAELANAWSEWSPYMQVLFSVYDQLAHQFGGFPALRNTSILPHNVTFLALVRLLPIARANGWEPEQLKTIINLHVDGHTDRSNPIWEGRCISFGNLKKNTNTMEKTAAMLARLLNIPLTGGLALLAPATSQVDDSSEEEQDGEPGNGNDFPDLLPPLLSVVK